MNEHEAALRLYNRLGQARANNGDKLSKEEWLQITAAQIKAEVDAVKNAPKAKRVNGDRNPLFDTLAQACGLNLADLTKSGARTVGVALADIQSVAPELTPEEIRARILRYKQLHPTWPLTVGSIAKNWASLGSGDNDSTGTGKLDVYQEPKRDWKPACLRLWGADIGAQIHAKGWFGIGTNYRKDILRDMLQNES